MANFRPAQRPVRGVASRCVALEQKKLARKFSDMQDQDMRREQVQALFLLRRRSG